MRDTMMNKNFPAGRFFLHSSYPPTFRSTLGSLRTHVEELGRVLSAQAQNDAIAKSSELLAESGTRRRPSIRSHLTPTVNDAAGKRPMR